MDGVAQRHPQPRAPLYLSGRARGERRALTNFLPDQGMVSTENLYPADKKDFSPRVGVAWTAWEDKKTVIRGAYGLFYDLFAVNFFTANTSFSNGGALGVGNNPGGTTPVFSITQRRFTYCPRRARFREHAAAAIRRVRRQPGSQARRMWRTSTSLSSGRSGQGHGGSDRVHRARAGTGSG